jgi:phosphatidylserine synthase
MSILLLIACVLLFLAAFGVSLGRVQTGWLGMACWCASLLVGPWYAPVRGPTFAHVDLWIFVLVVVLIAILVLVLIRRQSGKPGPFSNVLHK